jgi:hypothetical protein
MPLVAAERSNFQQRKRSGDSVAYVAVPPWQRRPRSPTNYTFGSEANGNTTLCRRTSGEVVLYAHDHAFHHVEVPGYPDYTFIALLGRDTYKEWGNTISLQ